MKTETSMRNFSRVKNFEDLKGQRAEGYIRDSDRDQKDGFGPEIQRKNILKFAEAYGLALGNRWYTEFISSFRCWDKRQQLQQFVDDAKLDYYDVLLCDHTSRFGRNQAKCIRYKEELKRLGKAVVFVSQGIISGSDRDFLAERINETLDEQYSRNISYYVSEGMGRKAEHGLHNGFPPLGYKSELIKGYPERKVQNPATMPALLALLRDYASGLFSFREVAERLNAQGFRMNNGNLFTGYSIRNILSNRFYEGKIVYHQGFDDEKVYDGKHDVPDEVRDLWRRCQEVKKSRAIIRLVAALENLRKQHIWDDISDEDYLREKSPLQRDLKILETTSMPKNLLNMERAAQFLNNLPALWSHEGVTNKQREALVRKVFKKITIDGKTLASIEPKPEYAPLFATVIMQNSVGYRDLDPPLSPPTIT
jgi:DNA invertase Pin-like site-specific DNA recombinase